MLLCRALICLRSHCPSELGCNLSAGRDFQLICVLFLRALKAVTDRNSSDQPHMGLSPTASGWRLRLSFMSGLALDMSISRFTTATPVPDCVPCWPECWLPQLASVLLVTTRVWWSGLSANPSCCSWACPTHLGAIKLCAVWWGPYSATCIMLLSSKLLSFREQFALTAPWLLSSLTHQLLSMSREAMESASLETVRTWLHTDMDTLWALRAGMQLFPEVPANLSYSGFHVC